MFKEEKELPSFTLKQIWNFVGERGVYSESPEHFSSCFDILCHYKGKLYYRMKLIKDRISSSPSSNTGFFKGVTFHDPMECFISRADTGDNVTIMATHYTNRDDEIDVLENDKDISLSEFEEIIKNFKANLN